VLQRYNIFSIIIILDNKKVHELHELSRINFFQKKYKKPLTPPSFIYIAAGKLNTQQITQKNPNKKYYLCTLNFLYMENQQELPAFIQGLATKKSEVLQRREVIKKEYLKLSDKLAKKNGKNKKIVHVQYSITKIDVI